MEKAHIISNNLPCNLRPRIGTKSVITANIYLCPNQQRLQLSVQGQESVTVVLEVTKAVGQLHHAELQKQDPARAELFHREGHPTLHHGLHAQNVRTIFHTMHYFFPVSFHPVQLGMNQPHDLRRNEAWVHWRQVEI